MKSVSENALTQSYKVHSRGEAYSPPLLDFCPLYLVNLGRRRMFYPQYQSAIAFLPSLALIFSLFACG